MYQQTRVKFNEIAEGIGSREQELLTVMGLALVDGVFPVLILSGALETPLQAIQVGLLVFGGSATAAVVFGEFDGGLWANLKSVMTVTIIISAIALIESMLAPVISSVLTIQRLEIFAAIALFIVAVRVSGASINKYLPSPVFVIGVGLLLSFQLGGAPTNVTYQTDLVFNTLIAVTAGSVFTATLVVIKHLFSEVINLERLQQGSAIALGLLVLALLGVVPQSASLAALGLTGVLSLEV